MELWEEILNQNNLNRAYKKGVANKGVAGVDGITVEEELMILLYLEVGKDFTFIGDEYRVQVGNHDFWI